MTNKSEENNPNVKKAYDIFLEYSDFILAVLTSKAGKRDRIEDLFQDYFVKLVSKPLPEGIINVKSYIYKSVTNFIYDHIRREETYKKNIGIYGEKLDFSTEETLISSEYYNKSDLISEKAMVFLSKNEKMLFELRFMKDLSLDEIAKITGLKKTSVSRYISKGMQKIRDNKDNIEKKLF